MRDPFTEQAAFDWSAFRKVVSIFTRMLDNVVEINQLPLAKQHEEIISKRRHGMGFLGLGSALTMLRIRYGSAAAVAFTEQVSQELALTGWRESLALAKEKGPALIMEQEFEVTGKLLRLRPEMAADGIKLGDKVKGKLLHARYSRYMQQVAEVDPALVAELAEVGGVSLTTAALHRPAPFRYRWPTTPATASSRALPITTVATSSSRARRARRAWMSTPMSCWPTASWSIRLPCPMPRMRRPGCRITSSPPTTSARPST